MSAQANQESKSLLKQSVTKTGRTLLVSSENDNFNENNFKCLVGLTSYHTTRNNSSFLVFDTIDNSVFAYEKLRLDYPNLRVKFARYRLFFTLTGLTESSDYNTVKQNFTTFVESNTRSSLLFFKLYRKNDKYIGCGDMTVDTKEAMDLLLNKNEKFNSFTLGDVSGNFFRFNNVSQYGNRQQVQNS
jgi:hypothetical protein